MKWSINKVRRQRVKLLLSISHISVTSFVSCCCRTISEWLCFFYWWPSVLLFTESFSFFFFFSSFLNSLKTMGNEVVLSLHVFACCVCFPAASPPHSVIVCVCVRVHISSIIPVKHPASKLEQLPINWLFPWELKRKQLLFVWSATELNLKTLCVIMIYETAKWSVDPPSFDLYPPADSQGSLYFPSHCAELQHLSIQHNPGTWSVPSPQFTCSVSTCFLSILCMLFITMLVKTHSEHTWSSVFCFLLELFMSDGLSTSTDVKSESCKKEYICT